MMEQLPHHALDGVVLLLDHVVVGLHLRFQDLVLLHILIKLLL